MSGLKNTFRRLGNFSMGRGYMTSGERKRKKAQKRQAARDKIYEAAVMPDEELIRRNERRKAARRQGSRASTILTNRETLG